MNNPLNPHPGADAPGLYLPTTSAPGRGLHSPTGSWQPDIYPGWQASTIALPADHEGPNIATLVRKAQPLQSKKAVLYIHGYLDYFYQTEMADHIEATGHRFYAIDLRKYGRSLLPGQTLNYIDHLGRYSQELDAAHRIMRSEGIEDITVLAHSTGGLIAALWLHNREHLRASGDFRVSRIAMNSPWFDLNSSWVDRYLSTLFVDIAGAIRPHATISRGDSAYSQSLHVDFGGSWEFNPEWKPLEPYPTRYGWLRAVRRGHAQLKRGLALSQQVLILTSDSSGPDSGWHDGLYNQDCVLDVRHMWKYAPRVSHAAVVRKIAGGLHDLALSAPGPRAAYYDTLGAWLTSGEAPAQASTA